jgi:hypothetical protein
VTVSAPTSSGATRTTTSRSQVRGFVDTLLANGFALTTARSRQLAVRRFSAWPAEEGEIETDLLMIGNPRNLPDWHGLSMAWRQRPDGEWERAVAIMFKSNPHKGLDTCSMRWVPASQLRPV